MLPRMIDIARAKLPGGNVGDYQIGLGMSGIVFGKLKLECTAFEALVANAADDTAVAARVCGDRSPADFARLNAFLANVAVKDVPAELAASFLDYYGSGLDPEQKIFDLLESDDARLRQA